MVHSRIQSKMPFRQGWKLVYMFLTMLVHLMDYTMDVYVPYFWMIYSIWNDDDVWVIYYYVYVLIDDLLY